jgi:thymidylate synthase
MVMKRDTATGLWLGALQTIGQYGGLVSPRGKRCREVRGVTLELTEPWNNLVTTPARKLNYHYAVAEWVWMWLGRKDVASLAPYNANIAAFSDDGKTFFGAYGPRIAAQWKALKAKLREDPDTRQAVLEIWRPDALTTATKDPPCTLSWQFFLRNGLLEMHAHMRSNDAWLGLPYDVFTFTQFQRMLASELGCELGRYVHHVGSLHLYEEHWDPAAAILHSYWEIPAVPTPAPHPSFASIGLGAILEHTKPLAELRELNRSTRSPAWREYQGVLLHRFTKDPTDLEPFFRGLLCDRPSKS